MKTNSSSLERRKFLNKLTSVVGGSTALAVTAPFVQAAPVEQAKEKAEPLAETKGYQRTKHVDTYYHLADF